MKELKKDSKIEISVGHLIMNPAGIKMCGGINAAFILCILVIRHFECKRFGLLSVDNSYFTFPKKMLEEQVELKMPTINKWLRVLSERNLVTVAIGIPGKPRLFKVNSRIIDPVNKYMMKRSRL